MRAVLLSSVLLLGVANAIELTFELPDNANQCFYEEIKADEDCLFEFHVVTGLQYDLDLVIQDPHGKVLNKRQKKQYGSYTFKTEAPGTYKACFSNEFSTFSHKVVNIDWQIGEGDAAKRAAAGAGETPAAMTALDSLASSIADKLRVSLAEETGEACLANMRLANGVAELLTGANSHIHCSALSYSSSAP